MDGMYVDNCMYDICKKTEILVIRSNFVRDQIHSVQNCQFAVAK